MADAAWLKELLNKVKMLSKLRYCFHSTYPGGMADAYGQLTQFSKRYKKLQNKITVLNCLPSIALSQLSATSVLLLKQHNLHACQF